LATARHKGLSGIHCRRYAPKWARHPAQSGFVINLKAFCALEAKIVFSAFNPLLHFFVTCGTYGTAPDGLFAKVDFSAFWRLH